MLEQLLRADAQLFRWLNGFHNPGWDAVMTAVTYRFTWFPLYGLVIYWLLRRYRWPGMWMVLTIVLTVALADQTASAFMKPYFARLRPCYEPALLPFVHNVGGCGGSFGFVSSHAATTFGLAGALWGLLRRCHRWVGWWFAWAAVVSYSRIYLGVHYPLDVLGGALVGLAWAALLVSAYRRIAPAISAQK